MLISKGNFNKFSDETYAFHQTTGSDNEKETNDTKITLSLWMVEKIRHRTYKNSGLRYDLRFTIIPIDDKVKKSELNLYDLRKRVFIMRDIDYPEYFSASKKTLQIKVRSDVFSMPLNYHRMSPKALNFGEYQKSSLTFPEKTQNYYNRFPVRFPDSRELMSSPKHVFHMQHKKPQEIYQLDHRAAAPDLRFHEDLSVRKERNQFYQPSLTIPMITVPQMSILHIPYTIPIHYQIPLSTNQRSLNTISKNVFPPRKQISLTEENNIGVNSIRVQKFSLPDVTNSTKTDTILSPKYSQKINDSEQNNDFKPIVPPVHYMSRTRERIAPTKKVAPEKLKNETRKSSKRVYTSSTESTSVKTKSYDIVATRPTINESPVLKWYPKKHRNKTLTATTPPPVETTPIIRNYSSTRSLLFRGRNRFLLSNELRRENFFRNLTTATENPTTVLSSKWKAITTKLIPTYETSTRENENESTSPMAFVELIPANVEELKSNSSNLEIYKAIEVEKSFLNKTVESSTISNQN